MTATVELVARATLIGVGGSAFIDLWSLALRRGLHIATLDYALLAAGSVSSAAGASPIPASPPPAPFGENAPSAGRRMTASASRSRSWWSPSGGFWLLP